MLGTLIGMATVGGLNIADPLSFDRGHKFMMGMSEVMPMRVGETLTYSANGNVFYEFGGQGYSGGGTRQTSGMIPKGATDLNKVTGKLTGIDGKTKQIKLGELNPTGFKATAMSSIGPLMSGYFIVQGFKEDGFAGAMDAYFMDIATSRATVSEMASRTVDKASGKVTITRRLGMMGSLGTGIGAFAGYEIGSQIAGVPGGFAGATLGAKGMSLLARYPISAGTLILGGLAAKKAGEVAVSKVGHILKEGNRRAKMRHRIDTAGSTASFFTRNAVTTRGRAFEAMRKSHLNARSALGMEATMTHMNRSYF